MTDRDRLRALCDAVDASPNDMAAESALVDAMPTATIRALLDAADERDALRTKVDALAVEMHAYKSWNRDYDALRAVAEQAREALIAASGSVKILSRWRASKGTDAVITQSAKALAALDAVLKEK